MSPPAELDGMCRLCLKNADPLEDIFEKNEGSLVLRIMACVSLEVHKMDNLPKKICAPCRYQLEKTYIFRSKCRENDSKLRRHVKLRMAGKASTVFEDLDDGDEEFASSLQFINSFDQANERKRQEELDLTIKAHDEKLQLEWEGQRKSICIEAIRQYELKRRRNRVDTEVETCSLSTTNEILSIVRDDEIDNEFIQVESTKAENEYSDNDSEESSQNQVLEDIEYETIEEDLNEQLNETISDSNTNLKQNIEARHEQEMISYLDQEVLMEVDELDDNVSTVTILNENNQSNYPRRESMLIHPSPSEPDGYVITEMDPDYVLDEELSQEERKLYDVTDDSDEDIEAVTNAVKAELAEQPGFNVGENCIMKVEKDRDLTKVEVRAEDGSIICMEFSTEPMKKPSESLATLRAKVAGAFKCPHCIALCKTPKLLQEHVHTTHPEHNKGHVCDVCAKWCPTKSGLERHYRIHTGEKPFVCGECGRGFVQKEILKRHMLVHTNEKPFVCKLCPNRYNQKDQLKHHVNVAHTENPTITIHKCSLCQKEFKYASGLSRHLSTHYGRTYACECGKEFTDKSAMKRHQRDVHGEGKKDKQPATVSVV